MFIICEYQSIYYIKELTLVIFELNKKIRDFNPKILLSLIYWRIE